LPKAEAAATCSAGTVPFGKGAMSMMRPVFAPLLCSYIWRSCAGECTPAVDE
jgi:hypothetical protein